MSRASWPPLTPPISFEPAKSKSISSLIEHCNKSKLNQQRTLLHRILCHVAQCNFFQQFTPLAIAK